MSWSVETEKAASHPVAVGFRPLAHIPETIPLPAAEDLEFPVLRCVFLSPLWPQKIFCLTLNIFFPLIVYQLGRQSGGVPHEATI